mmetsp:Transcript_19615/g.38885  ORF Transcript_19615/g.38885 Transcript_19615/m.38885 type:complete len:144 (-) Transcript_19615:370-801(-)
MGPPSMDFQELQTFFPSDEGLIEELGRLKLSDPSLGVQRLCERLHSRHPTWRFNAKRVRSVLKPMTDTSLGSSPNNVSDMLAICSLATDSADSFSEEDDEGGASTASLGSVGIAAPAALAAADDGNIDTLPFIADDEDWVIIQ